VVPDSQDRYVDDENPKRYDAGRLRYPTDLTDDEWALVVPLIPPAEPGGNKRMVDHGDRSRKIRRRVVQCTITSI
jgi:hypothetical protein